VKTIRVILKIPLDSFYCPYYSSEQ